MVEKVSHFKSLIEAFVREVFKPNMHITLGILSRNNMMILIFHVRLWKTTLRTRFILSGKDCNELGRDRFLIIILGVRNYLIGAGMS